MHIKHQHQPTSKTCVSACAAMLLNRQVEFIVDEFHAKYTNFEIDLEEYLARQNVVAERTLDRETILPGRIYVLTVPSLNSAGQLHAVVLDNRHGSGPLLYDPANGTSQRYTLDKDADPGFTLLTSWIVDYCIEEAPALDYKWGA